MPTIIKQHTKVNFTDVNIKVQFIVEHDTGVLGQTAKNNADYFETTYRGASANLFVDKTSIYEVVAPGKRAWHVGDDRDDSDDGINNSNTIGIELCAEKDGTYHPNTIILATWLTQKLMKDFNVPAKKVVRHYDASGKNCPQRMNVDGKWTLWFKYHKILTGSTVTVPVVTNTKKETVHVVKSGDTLWGLSKQYNATVAELKKWNNLKSDIITVGSTIKLGTTNSTPTVNPVPVTVTPKANLTIDGRWGKNTTIELQELFKTVVDGVISGQPSNESTKNIPSVKFGNGGSNLIFAMQKWAGTPQDGKISEKSSLITFLQKRFGTPVDGKVSNVSAMVKELQRRLNKGKL